MVSANTSCLLLIFLFTPSHSLLFLAMSIFILKVLAGLSFHSLPSFSGRPLSHLIMPVPTAILLSKALWMFFYRFALCSPGLLSSPSFTPLVSLFYPFFPMAQPHEHKAERTLSALDKAYGTVVKRLLQMMQSNILPYPLAPSYLIYAWRMKCQQFCVCM